MHEFNFIIETKKFDSFIPLITDMFAIIETYTLYSYGRVSVEAAALGIPVIGFEGVGSIKKCFPELACKNPYSILEYHSKITHLIQDVDFYEHVCNYAVESSEEYSFEHSRKVMLDFLGGK
jgi:hypothetical protein